MKRHRGIERLYTIWDQCERTGFNASGQLKDQILKFPKGAPREKILAWMESANPRVKQADLEMGLRLTPVLVAGADEDIPVFDAGGVQICVGDEVAMRIVNARAGVDRTWSAKMVVARLPRPLFFTASPYGWQTVQLSIHEAQSSRPFMVADHSLPGSDGGHREWCEIIATAPATPQQTEAEEHTPGEPSWAESEES